MVMKEFKLFNVPKCAWTRQLGNYPKGATGKFIPLEDDIEPIVRTKRGIPLGGIGTGSFMWNLAGSFGPFNFDCGGDDSTGSMWGKEIYSGLEERYLKGAGFHLAVKSHNESNYNYKFLATEDSQDSWTNLNKGSGTYRALFPQSWCSYDLSDICSEVVLEVQQLSPYIPNNDKWLSTPGSAFKFKISNESDDKLQLRLGLSFPNAIYKLDTEYTYVRDGLFCEYESENDHVAVRLKSDHKDNVPETQKSEWVILAGLKNPTGLKDPSAEKLAAASYSNEAFEKGLVDFMRQSQFNSNLSNLGDWGVVGVSFDINPNETKECIFVLSWDFPIAQFKNPIEGTKWKKRYTEFYEGDFVGYLVAKELFENFEYLNEEIIKWQEPFLSQVEVDDEIKMAVYNELYYDIFGSSFWENGCIDKPKQFGNRKNQHLSFVLECPVYRDCETLDVHYYEARHRIDLTNSIERDLLMGWADLIKDEPMGRTPHDAGSPVNDPWFKYGQYFATAKNLDPVTMTWKDLPSRYVQLVHAYFKESDDFDFLEQTLGACEKAMNYLISTDEDKDDIPDCVGFDTSYDGLGLRGAVTHVASLYIGALLGLVDMEKHIGNSQMQEYYLNKANLAKASVEDRLFDDKLNYYRAATKGDLAEGIMPDALCGELFSVSNGLGHVLDPVRMINHLKVAYEKCVVPFSGRGAVNLINKDGTVPEAMMAKGVWPGGSYFTAAIMIRLGKKYNDTQLINMGVDITKGVIDTTYFDESAAFWFNTPAIWYPGENCYFRSQQNQRPRAIYEVYLALLNG